MVRAFFTLLFLYISTSYSQAQQDSIMLQKMYEEAIELNKKNEYKASKALLDSALVIAYPTVGKQNLVTSRLHGLQVYVLQRLDEYDEAERHYHLATEIVNDIRGYPNGSNVILNSNMSQIYMETNRVDSAIVLMRRTLPIALEHMPDDHERHARVCVKLGLAFWREGKMDSVELHFVNALKFFDGKNKESALYAGLCNNLGITYFNKANFRKAKELFERSYDIFARTMGADSRQATQPLMNIGNALSKMGKNEEAIEYYEQTLRNLATKDAMKSSNYYVLIENLSNAKGNLGRFEEAIKLKMSIADYYESNSSIMDQSKLTLYHGIASEYFNLNQVDSALFYLKQKADPINAKLNHEANTYQAFSNLLASKCYFEKGQINKAAKLIELSLDETAQIKDGDNRLFLDAYNVKAHQAAKQNKKEDFNEAIALAYANLSFDPKADAIDGSFSRLEELLWVQTQHIKGLDDLYTHQQQEDYLQTILAQFELFKQNIDLQSESNINSSSFYDMSNASQEVFNIALKAALAMHEKSGGLNFINQAMDIVNTNRSRKLLASMRAKSKIKFNDIPDEVLEEKVMIEDSILYYKNVITEQDSMMDLAAAKTNLFALLRERDNWNASISSKYPAYSSVTGKSTSERNINLGTHDLIIDSHLTEEMAVVFFISQDQVVVNKIEKPLAFYHQVEQYINELKSGKNNVDLVNQISRSIFNNYTITEGIENINIVPSNLLLQLPFEILTYDDSSLMNSYNISYHANQSLIKGEDLTRSVKVRSLACFAPEYKEDGIDSLLLASNKIYASVVRDGNYALPGAQLEVSKIEELLGGDAYVGSEANEASFVAHSLDKDIVHLAMHSIMNEENGMNSFLLFGDKKDSLYDQKLFAFEVYQLEMENELLVLSACNTGTGELQDGEGSLSMAHAFQYAGAKSIVSSLWRVPDEASAYLMTKFYSFLKDGLRKDHALREAKLAYINDETIPDSQKTPYYYAGFIATGDMSPLDFVGPYSSYLYGFGMLMIGLLLWFFKGRNKKSPS